MKRLAVTVLAAGLSRRFGETNKLLAMVNGKPLLTHALHSLNRGAFSARLAIIPENAAAIAALCGNAGFECIKNSAPERGMAHSIALAAKKATGADGLMIALGDMPFIKAETIGVIVSAFEAAPEKAIVAPVLNGRRGHPVVFSSCFLPELSTLDGDAGASAIIMRHNNKFIGIDTDDLGVLQDIDTRADAASAHKA